MLAPNTAGENIAPSVPRRREPITAIFLSPAMFSRQQPHHYGAARSEKRPVVVRS